MIDRLLGRVGKVPLLRWTIKIIIDLPTMIFVANRWAKLLLLITTQNHGLFAHPTMITVK